MGLVIASELLLLLLLARRLPWNCLLMVWLGLLLRWLKCVD